MRILWLSDSPTTPSGLGNITRALCDRLARLGHQLSIVGWQRAGRPVRRRGYTVYPVADLASEAELLLGYLHRLRPDVLVTVADTWRVSHLAHPAVTRFRQAAGVPWVLYHPIDSDCGDRAGLPERVLRVLKASDLPVVMSRHGQRVVTAAGVRAAYIPVGVDTDVFHPPDERETAKRAIGYGHRFVVLCDARNQVRKLWPRALEIFRRFAAGKDDVVLHFHCDPYDPATVSAEYRYDLISDIKALGLACKVRFTAGMSIVRGLPLVRLAALYRAADVHVLSAFAEGFGMPTLQAAASGVVPLAPAYAANRELVRGHGEAIRVQQFVRRESGFRCAFVDIDDAARRLERLYRDRRLLGAKSHAARCFALAYDWDRVAIQWHRFLRHHVPAAATGSRRVRIRHGRPPMIDSVDTEVRLPRPTVTIPVTLPPSRFARGETRVTGRVYLASAADLPVFRRLRRIFPGLTSWSTTTTVPAGGSAFRRQLATSTLALDVAGTDSRLPLFAAQCSTPCVASSRIRAQAALWPSLAVTTTTGVGITTRLARRMLADQCEAADVCASARKVFRTLRSSG